MLRVLASKPDIEKKEDCAFHHDGFCVLNDRECDGISPNAMRRYEGFSQRDYLEMYWRRRERRADLWLHIISIALSLAAVVVATLALDASEKKPTSYNAAQQVPQKELRLPGSTDERERGVATPKPIEKGIDQGN